MSAPNRPRRVTRASARAASSNTDDNESQLIPEKRTRKRTTVVKEDASIVSEDETVAPPPKKKVTRAKKAESSAKSKVASQSKKIAQENANEEETTVPADEDAVAEQKKKKAKVKPAKKTGSTRTKKSKLTSEEEAEKAKWYEETTCDQPWGPVDNTLLKIVSWNINGAKSVVNSGQLLSYLEREEPDILFIQETKYTAETVKGFPELPAYDIHWNHCTAKKGYSGLGLLIARDRLEKKNVSVVSVDAGMGEEEADAEGRVLTVVLSNGLALVNCYVPNAGQKLPRLPYRVETFEPAMRKFLGGLREKHRRVVYCGDLNVAHEECDIHNSKANQKNSGHTPEERAAFGDMMKEGWVDVMRHIYPYKRCYTYFSLRFGDRLQKENKGWRIDYFITTPFEKEEVVDMFVRYDQLGSDHKPAALLVKA